MKQLVNNIIVTIQTIPLTMRKVISLQSTDNEYEVVVNYEGETSFDKKNPTIEVNSKSPNVIEFRRALC